MVTVADPTAQAVVPTLPGRYYSDPAIFALEQEHILARSWLCVGRAGQLAAAGEYMTVEVAGESVIVLREREGSVRAFYNICRHRGARLCPAEAGRLHATMQCRYHAWTYALDGHLVGAPNMREDASFDPGEHGLVPVAVQVWEGLIFLNLADQPQPLTAQGDVEHHRIKRYKIAALQVARSIEYDVRANWKLIVANYEECAHCALVHPELSAQVPSFRAGLASGDLDDGADFAEGITALNDSGQRNVPPLPGLLPEDYRRYYGLTLRPNLFINFNPDHVGTTVLWPLGPDRTRVVSEWLFDPQAMAQPGFDPSEAVAFSDRVKRQDWEVCELSQQGVGSRAFRDGGIYGPHERHIRDFDDYVLAGLRHTVE